MPSLDHSVKHNSKFDKTYKALKDTFDDDEDSDDMIGNMPVYNEKEATNSIENDQNTVGSDHEVTGRNERIDNVTESAFSVRDGIQIYLDDIIVYEDENKENEADHNDRGFIDTDDILDYLMPKRVVPEKSKVNITGNSCNINESNEGSRNHESQGVDDPKQGSKTSNRAKRKLDIESETEPNISITWNSHISPIKADIIDNDEHDEEEHNHQITNKFKETVTDIDPVKIVLAEILIEEKDTVIQWNKVEIWKSDAISNNTSLSSLIEEGIDALKFNWLDTDEEPDKDIFWDAESCKLDMHMDCESESEEEIFWDSLSQL